MKDEIVVRRDDLSGRAARDLIAFHLGDMRATSPPGHVFALDASGLMRPGVTVWSAWSGEAICGIGALMRIDDESGEIKSMRTHPNFLRRGVGGAILDTIIAEARQRNLRRLCLETGSGAAFEAALALYRRRGFVSCGAFGDYEPGEFNQFLQLSL